MTCPPIFFYSRIPDVLKQNPVPVGPYRGDGNGEPHGEEAGRFLPARIFPVANAPIWWNCRAKIGLSAKPFLCSTALPLQAESSPDLLKRLRSRKSKFGNLNDRASGFHAIRRQIASLLEIGNQ